MIPKCPKCQSPKIMPVASANGPRPEIPRSLGVLIISLLVLLLFVATSLAFLVLGKKMSLLLQFGTIGSFIVFAISAFMIYKQFPTFKANMQKFMQSQKHWKCRECNHQWENQ